MSKKKNVVFTATPGHNNAVLNWARNPKGEFVFYGDAYHQAGKDVLDAALRNRSQNSIKFAPVIFLYRHALELNLKSIIIQGNLILGLQGQPVVGDEKLFSTHSLTHLIQAVEQIINYQGWTEGFERGCIETFADCKKVVNDFNKVDQQSYTFRYPIDKNGIGSVDHHFTFDVRLFAERLDPVIELMSSVADALGHEYDSMCEAIGEERQRAMEYAYENADHEDYDPGDC